MKFETVKDLIESCGGLREVAYRLDYDSTYIRKVVDCDAPFGERMAFRFLKEYDIDLKDIQHLIK